MKALVKTAKGPGHLELREIPIPKCGPDDALMKVWGSGICGTDVHIYRDEYSIYVPPLTIGHEFSAEVAEVGRNVTHIKPGDRVVCDVTTQTGIMGNDTVNGCHAEYIVMPANLVLKLPDNISLREAVLMEPIVACQHGILERVRMRPGDFVAVIGPGPIGLMMLQVANLYSPVDTLITGKRGADAPRMEVARKLGAGHLFYNDDNVVETVMSLTNGKGADVVIEASGSDEGFNQALDMAKIGGQILSYAVYDNTYVKANLSKISWKCLDVTSSWCFWGYTEEATRATGGIVSWQRAIRILATGKLNLEPFITHELPLDRWEEGFDICEQKTGVKVILRS